MKRTDLDLTRRAALLAGFGVMIGAPSAFAQASDPLRSFTIPSASMEPTLMVGDVVLTRWTGRPGAPALQRGDIVIFRREGIFWVKRLIGLAGDRVAIHQGVPSVNGRPLAQEVRGGLGSGRSAKLLVETNEARRYRIQMGPASARRPHRSGSARQMATVQVPEGSIYVLGDNRDDSFDSRSFGPVPIADLRFVAMQILFSNTPERIGLRLDRPPP